MNVAESDPWPVKPASTILRYVAPGACPLTARTTAMIANATSSDPTGTRTESHHGCSSRRSRRIRGPAPARHEQPDLLDRRGTGVELARDLALVHDEDAIREGADLVEVLAQQQDRHALGRGLPKVRVHRLDRADVEPARRLGDDEDERIV